MNPVAQKVIYNYHSYIQFLPKTEQEILNYFKKGLKQKEIAVLRGTTQGAISSRLSRIKKRLAFIRDLRKFQIDDQDLDRFGPLNKAILKTMAETTCQSETASRMNNLFNLSGDSRMTQIKVRHRYGKCLVEMKKLSDKDPNGVYPQYLKFFTLIKTHLYTLHEVRLPHFGN